MILIACRPSDRRYYNALVDLFSLHDIPYLDSTLYAVRSLIKRCVDYPISCVVVFEKRGKSSPKKQRSGFGANVLARLRKAVPHIPIIYYCVAPFNDFAGLPGLVAVTQIIVSSASDLYYYPDPLLSAIFTYRHSIIPPEGR